MKCRVRSIRKKDTELHGELYQKRCDLQDVMEDLGEYVLIEKIKLVHRFLGLPVEFNDDVLKYRTGYHIDWGHLMDVVSKLEEFLGDTGEKGDTLAEHIHYGEFITLTVKDGHIYAGVNVTDAFNEVVSCIEWLNNKHKAE